MLRYVWEGFPAGLVQERIILFTVNLSKHFLTLGTAATSQCGRCNTQPDLFFNSFIEVYFTYHRIHQFQVYIDF